MPESEEAKASRARNLVIAREVNEARNKRLQEFREFANLQQNYVMRTPPLETFKETPKPIPQETPISIPLENIPDESIGNTPMEVEPEVISREESDDTTSEEEQRPTPKFKSVPLLDKRPRKRRKVSGKHTFAPTRFETTTKNEDPEPSIPDMEISTTRFYWDKGISLAKDTVYKGCYAGASILSMAIVSYITRTVIQKYIKRPEQSSTQIETPQEELKMPGLEKIIPQVDYYDLS
jgi:hypothetical protein